jgi:DNA-binding Lrp family transcriptional regulator
LRNPKIDETDATILSILLGESRTSFTNIAKTCNISVGAVRMRYAKLKKTGIITGEVMQINPQSIGYHCISDLGITTDKENEETVGNFLKNKPYLTHSVSAANNYNFWAKAQLRNIQELNGIIAELEENPLIKHVDTFIWDETVFLDHPENFRITPNLNIKGKKANSELATLKEKETKLDQTDLQIAKILSHHSRTPFRKIAEQTGISTKSVIQRYKKLRKNVLTHSTIMLDISKLGYNAWGHIFLKAANRSKMPQIYKKILQIPNLIVTIRYIGAYDLYATVALANYEELFTLTENLRRTPDIQQTDMFIGRVFPQWPLNLFTSLL